MSFITGVGSTAFGRHEGLSSLDLMGKAADLAISDAGLKRTEIDGVLCGYSTVSPHIMLATVFAEHFGIRPSYAHAVQVGGATGLAMTMLAHHLVDAGVVKHVLVVGGENRLTGQSRDASILALAQVGHPDYEVPLGPTIPAYYGLVASRYMHEYGVTQEDLAEFAVLMRTHALAHPGAQFHEPISVADVMESRPVALPLKLLDCCPVSDGGAAFVVSREPTSEIGVRIRGCAQTHTHQHVTAAPALSESVPRLPSREPKPRRVWRHRMCVTPGSMTVLPSRWRSCWKISVLLVGARRRRGSDQVTLAARGLCRSIPMAAC